MIERDLYVVLGVDPEESDQGIRSAFRDLAKRYHPDRVGEGGAAAFREIEGAFRVLSDGEQRRDYDGVIGQREPSRVTTSAPRVASHVEPLIPDQTSLRRGGSDIGPSAEALFGRVARNFNGLSVPKAERLEPLDVQLVLSPWEAEEGGTFVIGIPVFSRCPSCSGHGRTLLLQCVACAGQGLIEGERGVTLDLPPNVDERASFVVRLDELGIRNLILRVRVRIAS
jgi:molecular chaperone DnaJ